MATQFYLLKNTTKTQMFGCIFKTQAKTIVFDGGVAEDYLQIYNFVKKNSNLHIDAWFFTHPHYDHIGAFCQFCESCQDVRIELVYHCFPTTQEIVLQGDRGEGEKYPLEHFHNCVKDKNVGGEHCLKANDQFIFDELSIKVLRVYNPEISVNFSNNSSAVYRVENAKKSFLILGDLGVEGGEEVMRLCKKEDLQTDYTQMAHHGQCGVSKEFYEYIKPKRCIWPAPDWLWDNNAGEGFDTGPWQTVRTREWMESLSVKEHFIEKDGIQKIEF